MMMKPTRWNEEIWRIDYLLDKLIYKHEQQQKKELDHRFPDELPHSIQLELNSESHNHSIVKMLDNLITDHDLKI